MTRLEMYNKLCTLDGYGVIKHHSDNSKQYLFYEVFPGESYKSTMDRILSHGITPENDLILKNMGNHTIFAVEKVYQVSEEYQKQYDLWYRDRIKMYFFDGPVDYHGAKTSDSAFNY